MLEFLAGQKVDVPGWISKVEQLCLQQLCTGVHWYPFNFGEDGTGLLWPTCHRMEADSKQSSPPAVPSALYFLKSPILSIFTYARRFHRVHGKKRTQRCLFWYKKCEIHPYCFYNSHFFHKHLEDTWSYSVVFCHRHCVRLRTAY